jgi:hypothetical protein
MGVTAGLSSARARMDERVTYAKDKKHASMQSEAEAMERAERSKASMHVFNKKKHPQDDARDTQERMVHLTRITLVSSCVQVDWEPS